MLTICVEFKGLIGSLVKKGLSISAMKMLALVVIQFVAPTIGLICRGGLRPVGICLCNFGITRNLGTL